MLSLARVHHARFGINLVPGGNRTAVSVDVQLGGNQLACMRIVCYEFALATELFGALDLRSDQIYCECTTAGFTNYHYDSMYLRI